MKGYLYGVKTLTFKELKDSFASPLIYSITGLFCVLMGWLFFNYLISSKELTDQTLTQSVLIPVFGNMNFIFLFLAPLLTMKSFSEEKKLHTLELLLTSRLTHFQIIISKLIATFLMALFMVAITFIFPIILAMSGYDHWPVVFSAYGGVLFSILCYLTVGIFASAMCENLIVSAILSFCILLGLMLFSITGNATNNVIVAQMFQYLAIPYHFESFVRGGIKSYNLVYMSSFICFFIYLTHIKLESRKW